MESNSVYKKKALVDLEGNWIKAAVATLVCMAMSMATNFLAQGGQTAPTPEEAMMMLATYVGVTIGAGIVLYPLSFGFRSSFLAMAKEGKYDFAELFYGFRRYAPVLITMFMKNIYIALWSLLLIVPGIVKYYSYSMTEFIMREYEGMKYNEAIEDSMYMMKGQKMKLFMLDLSLIGWFILSCLTLGIGFLFLIPYMHTAHAEFYRQLRIEVDAAIEAESKMA